MKKEGKGRRRRGKKEGKRRRKEREGGEGRRGEKGGRMEEILKVFRHARPTQSLCCL